MREWFTPKEKLPEINTKILFTTDKLVGHIGEYKPHEIFFDSEQLYKIEEVKAWAYIHNK